MTRIRIASITACLSALILTATTHAAPSEPRDPAARRAEMMKKFDKDGDGKLNEEERAALREEGQKRRKEIIVKFDKDGDGKLNEEERKAAGAEMRKNRGGRSGGDAGKPGKRPGKRPAPGEGDGRPKGGKRPGKKGTTEKEK